MGSGSLDGSSQPISMVTPGWCPLCSGKGSGTLRKSQDIRITSFQAHPTAQRVSCHPTNAQSCSRRAKTQLVTP